MDYAADPPVPDHGESSDPEPFKGQGKGGPKGHGKGRENFAPGMVFDDLSFPQRASLVTALCPTNYREAEVQRMSHAEVTLLLWIAIHVIPATTLPANRMEDIRDWSILKHLELRSPLNLSTPLALRHFHRALPRFPNMHLMI